MAPPATRVPGPTGERPGSPLFALFLVPAAALVALLLLVLRLHFQPPTVPTYVLERGDGPTEAYSALALGGEFDLTLRPESPVVGAVAARAFLIRGNEVRPWDLPFSVSPDGLVHMSAPVRAAFSGVPPGEWEVAVAVGRPETLPTAPNDILRARDAGPGPASWRLLRAKVRVGER
jgi:hypothetical protein